MSMYEIQGNRAFHNLMLDSNRSFKYHIQSLCIIKHLGILPHGYTLIETYFNHYKTLVNEDKKVAFSSTCEKADLQIFPIQIQQTFISCNSKFNFINCYQNSKFIIDIIIPCEKLEVTLKPAY